MIQKNKTKDQIPDSWKPYMMRKEMEFDRARTLAERAQRNRQISDDLIRKINQYESGNHTNDPVWAKLTEVEQFYLDNLDDGFKGIYESIMGGPRTITAVKTLKSELYNRSMREDKYSFLLSHSIKEIIAELDPVYEAYPQLLEVA
jgi:hypothetical protein